MSTAKKPLHICIFSDERAIHTRRWVRGLREMGHRVDLITLIKDKDDEVGGISLNAAGKWSYFTKIWKLKSLVRKLNPDILHTHYASSFGFLASFVKHPRKILSVWGSDIVMFPDSNLFCKAIIRRSLAKTIQITATSDFLKQTVLQLDSRCRSVRVIPFGIDTELFRYVQRSFKGSVKIGIAKLLRPNYGLEILIRAVSALLIEDYDIELIIAGRGESEDYFKSLVTDMGLEQKITFTGFVDHAQMPAFLSGIDIFAMPSFTESFGVAALEASATGLPVVATKVGGVPEVVLNNKTGILIEPRNVEELGNALKKFISVPALREKMGRAGRTFVESNYRWELNLQAMSDLYAEVIR